MRAWNIATSSGPALKRSLSAVSGGLSADCVLMFSRDEIPRWRRCASVRPASGVRPWARPGRRTGGAPVPSPPCNAIGSTLSLAIGARACSVALDWRWPGAALARCNRLLVQPPPTGQRAPRASRAASRGDRCGQLWRQNAPAASPRLCQLGAAIAPGSPRRRSRRMVRAGEPRAWQARRRTARPSCAHRRWPQRSPGGPRCCWRA